MPSHDMPPSRWSLLHIPPTTTEEIALLPCDGCDRHPDLPQYIQEIAQEIAPHLVCVHSIPPLVFHKATGNLHRYEEAQARISIAGCEENCPRKLLSSLKPVEREIILSPELPPDAQKQMILDTLYSCTSLLPQTPESTAYLPPAALTHQRRRFVETPQKKTLEPQKALEPKTPLSSPSLSASLSSPSLSASLSSPSLSASLSSPSLSPPLSSPSLSASLSSPNARFSESPAVGLFQDQASSVTRKRISFVVFLLLLIGGGVGWRIWSTQNPQAISPNTPKTAQLTKQEQEKPLSTSQKPLPAAPSTAPASAKPQETASKTSPEKGSAPPKAPPSTEKTAPPPQASATEERKTPPARPKPPSPEEAAHLMRSKMVNQSWFGGACKEASQCGYESAICLPVPDEGYCSQSCVRWCKRSRNPWHTASACISAKALAPYLPMLPLGQSKGGLCLSVCDFTLFPKYGCRVGTRCLALPLSQRETTKRICVPHNTAAQSTQSDPKQEDRPTEKEDRP